MLRYRNRPSCMLAAPILTLPVPIVRTMLSELLSYGQPLTTGVAEAIAPQVGADSPAVTLTLSPTHLDIALGVLLEVSLDMGDGKLDPGRCGFTQGQVHEAIDAHQHHYGPLWGP